MSQENYLELSEKANAGHGQYSVAKLVSFAQVHTTGEDLNFF